MEIQMHPARPQNSHQPDETELPEGGADVSRSKFLRGGALALGAGTLGAAATAAGAPAEAHPGKGVGPGLDPNPEYRRRSEEHTSELQSRGQLVCRLLLAKKNTI